MLSFSFNNFNGCKLILNAACENHKYSSIVATYTQIHKGVQLND